MLPVCYPSSPSPTTGLPEAVAYALSSVSGLTRWVDYIPIKLVSGALGVNEQSTNAGGFTPMRLLGSAIGMAAWSDYIPVYVDNSATEAWVTSATGYIPYANSVAGATTPSFYLNLSNPSNATILDGEGRGTITSTYNAHITMSASLSRVVGVAPLYVNIDMTGTTSDLTANATHDLFYSVNWGDPDAGQWANGVQSPGLTDKNWSFGPVGGHVFETPGTYLVTPTSTDGVNSAAKPGYVTVLDPNEVYAGTDTICISHSNNFTGAPSGATQVNTSGNTDMYSLLNTYKASNKRILFCKADSWTCSDQVSFTSLTGLTIDGYGTGVARAFGSGTLIPVTPANFGAVSDAVFLAGSGITDLKICSMKITADSSHNAGAGTHSSVGLMFSKVEIRGAQGGWNINASQNPTEVIPEQTCLYECVVDDLSGAAFYDTPNAVTATYDATTDIFTATGHGKAINDPVKVRTNESQSMPVPLDAAGPMGAIYYISATNFTANQFSLSLTAGGAVIDITSTGTCTVADDELNGGIGAYVALTKGGIMGCYFDCCNHGEQVVRIPFADRAHINNNYFARPNQTKNNFRIHSVIHSYFPVWSEKWVVSANVITNEGGYDYNGTTVNRGYSSMCWMGSAGNAGVGGEWVRNGIFENNFIKGSLGYPKDALIAVGIGGPTITIRNNIVDFSMGNRTSAVNNPSIYSALVLVDVNTSTADPTINTSIYNNTLFSNLANGEMGLVVTFTAPTGGNPQPDVTKIQNNILYLPNHASAFYRATYKQLAGAAATNITSTYNTDEVSTITTTPNFAVYPPVALADWRPTTGYAVNGGTTVPVLRDFNNASRYGSTYDLGAVLP